ncbi:MAG: hypothetical protein ABEJ89_09465 [Haloarculaceae archaeon]
MGVRPPADDTDEPEVIEFGIAALDEQLESVDVTFPTDTATLRERAGHLQVPYDASGNTVGLDSLLAEVGPREFEHEQELLNALHPVLEGKREAAGRSLLAQLRSLVPF